MKLYAFWCDNPECHTSYVPASRKRPAKPPRCHSCGKVRREIVHDFGEAPPKGLCQCGCGERTTIAEETNSSERIVKGEPRRFVAGHSGRNPTQIIEDSETHCWIWQLTTSHGYGSMKQDGLNKRAHRAYYEDLVGSIPEGLILDHLCRNPSCVNPGHLEPVTWRENTLRGDSPAGINARKTRCKSGHPFNKANTYVAPNGARCCRTCRRLAVRRYMARKRSAA